VPKWGAEERKGKKERRGGEKEEKSRRQPYYLRLCCAMRIGVHGFGFGAVVLPERTQSGQKKKNKEVTELERKRGRKGGRGKEKGRRRLTWQ